MPTWGDRLGLVIRPGASLGGVDDLPACRRGSACVSTRRGRCGSAPFRDGGTVCGGRWSGQGLDGVPGVDDVGGCGPGGVALAARRLVLVSGLRAPRTTEERASVEAAVNYWTAYLNEWLPMINKVREDHGLEHLPSVFAAYDRAERVLLAVSEAFDFRADYLPSNMRYVGPLLDPLLGHWRGSLLGPQATIDRARWCLSELRIKTKPRSCSALSMQSAELRWRPRSLLDLPSMRPNSKQRPIRPCLAVLRTTL